MWILKSIKNFWADKLFVLYSLAKPLEPLGQGVNSSLITVSSPLCNTLYPLTQGVDPLT